MSDARDCEVPKVPAFAPLVESVVVVVVVVVVRKREKTQKKKNRKHTHLLTEAYMPYMGPLPQNAFSPFYFGLFDVQEDPPHRTKEAVYVSPYLFDLNQRQELIAAERTSSLANYFVVFQSCETILFDS